MIELTCSQGGVFVNVAAGHTWKVLSNASGLAYQKKVKAENRYKRGIREMNRNINKRYTISQVTKELNRFFDLFDEVLEEVLKEEFGFGEKRTNRVRLALEKKLLSRMNRRLAKSWQQEMENS